MWTAREKELTGRKEIIAYIDEIDAFHDFRIGHIEIKNDTIKLFIEEYKDKCNISDALIWNFTFSNCTNITVDIDSMLSFYVTEIEVSKDDVIIGLTNGFISFRAESILLGIPSKQR